MNQQLGIHPRREVFLYRVFIVLACCALFGECNVFKKVPVMMNKVWPMSNPVETYRYYDFPFCAPEHVEEVEMSFGQGLQGDRLTSSLYEFVLGVPVEKKELCEKNLTSGDISSLRAAIGQQYIYEMFVGELPVLLAFGSVSPESGEARLCTHVKFEVSFRQQAVVFVKSDCEEESELRDGGGPMTFFYSVQWRERNDVDPEDSWWIQQAQMGDVLKFIKTGRMSLVPISEEISVSQAPIHWISILNSLCLALMICGFVLTILVRIVRADLSKYMPSDDTAIELGSSDRESEALVVNWKLLHGDVFRPPPHRMWLSASVGAGVQLIFVFGTLLLVATLGVVYPQRGALVSAPVVLYMMSSVISGYISARLYHRMGGVKWKFNMIVTSLLFSGPAFAVWSVLNTVAIAYNSTAAFPFETILQLFAMWGLVTIPLTVIGGTIGRQIGAKTVKEIPFPVKTNRLPREVPIYSSVAYTKAFQIIVSGFLCFLSAYLELNYIFRSVWSEGRVYTLYGILLIALLLLFVLGTVLTVLFTYVQLNAEDYRWWWRSFTAGGSVAVFVYAYSIFFYANSQMSGGLQTTFFFLYSALIAYGLALTMGASSFAASYQFVWFIYKHVKSD